MKWFISYWPYNCSRPASTIQTGDINDIIKAIQVDIQVGAFNKPGNYEFKEKILGKSSSIEGTVIFFYPLPR